MGEPVCSVRVVLNGPPIRASGWANSSPDSALARPSSSRLGSGLPIGPQNRPKTAAELSDEVGAAEHSLTRLLRALADMGVLRRAGDAGFALTPVGALLRSDVGGSLRPTALMEGSPWMRAAWGELSHSVKTGEPAADHALGQSVYDYLRERPEQEQVFNSAGLLADSGFRLGRAIPTQSP